MPAFCTLLLIGGRSRLGKRDCLHLGLLSDAETTPASVERQRRFELIQSPPLSIKALKQGDAYAFGGKSVLSKAILRALPGGFTWSFSNPMMLSSAKLQ